MRLSYTLLIVATILLASVEARRPYLSAIWKSWKFVHGKSYSSMREEHLRQRIFQANYMFTRWHNERYFLGLETYTTALNQFADLTLKEFSDKYLTLQRSELDAFMRHVPVRRLDRHRYDTPEGVDWREKGYVTPIKNQVFN